MSFKVSLYSPVSVP